MKMFLLYLSRSKYVTVETMALSATTQSLTKRKYKTSVKMLGCNGYTSAYDNDRFAQKQNEFLISWESNIQTIEK